MGSDSIDFVYPNKLLIHSINWGLTPIISVTINPDPEPDDKPPDNRT